MKLSLLDLAEILHQPMPLENHMAQDIIIDSRLVKPGVVFVAIKGENFDGFDFVSQALEQGAIAVVVDRAFAYQGSAAVFQVADTRLALGQIAHAYRQRFNIPFVAVTGSCGKTSTTAMIASLLRQKGKTLAPQGTFNNDIGVPLTLFRLSADDQFAVIEIGANHVGEIDYLAKLVMPTVALITNSAPVHLEGFGSLQGVRQGKGEIYQNLMPDGIAVVNADDGGADYWHGLVQGKTVIRFGLDHTADVYATEISLNNHLQASFLLHMNQAQIDIHLPVIGVHQVANALAAAAVACSQGLTLNQIKAGLESTPLVAQRGIIQSGYNDSLIIDDSYNANPTAFKAAIDLLMAVPHVSQHILVMGDMGELGADAQKFHADIGALAKQAGVSALYTVGPLSQAASDCYGANAFHFTDQASLIKALQAIVGPDVCVLIKGSKSSHMDEIVAGLKITTG